MFLVQLPWLPSEGKAADPAAHTLSPCPSSFHPPLTNPCCAATDGTATADLPCSSSPPFCPPWLLSSSVILWICCFNTPHTHFRNSTATLAPLLVYSPLSSGMLMSSVYIQRVLKTTMLCCRRPCEERVGESESTP